MGIFKKWFSKKESENCNNQEPKKENTTKEECPSKVGLTLVGNQTFPYYQIGDKFDGAKCTNFMHVDKISLHVFNNCLFTNTYFSSTTINRAVFINCTFNNVMFYNTRLVACVFEKCSFDSANAGVDTDSKFVSCIFQSTKFSECKFLRAKFDTVLTANQTQPINLKDCKFGRVSIVNTNIGGILLPEEEEMRYGKILSEPIIGWKTAIPILDRQYEKIKNEVDCNGNKYTPSYFINEHGLNKETTTPFIISTEEIYNMYLAFVELEIPKGAVVFTTDNINFRTNKAVVRNVYMKTNIPIKGCEFPTIEIGQAVSKFDNETMYVVGETIEVGDFPLNPTQTDCPGIYFCTGTSNVTKMFYDGLKWKKNQENGRCENLKVNEKTGTYKTENHRDELDEAIIALGGKELKK